MYDNSTATRQAMIDACLRMNRDGVNQGTSGNISVRCGDEMLITPSGMPYDSLAPKDIVRVSLVGAPQVRGLHKPSSEWKFHRDLLNARPDTNAIIHAHPVHATALSMLRDPLPACHYMVGLFGGTDVRVADYARFGSESLSKAVITATKDRHGCLMANHGATVLGDTLDIAFWRLSELEVLCQSYLLARAAGDVVLLSNAEMSDAIKAFSDYGPRKD